MSSLGELFINLGVFADTKELKDFEKKFNKFTKDAQKELNKMQKIAKGVTLAVGAIAGAAYAINRLTNDLVQSNQAMLNLTRTSDISLSTFQKWNGIGKMLGVNNAAQQLEGLNQRLFELRLTGQGARGFQLAGINPAGLDAEGVLEQLRGRIQGMDDTSASYLLREMGLDPQMLHILRLGREEFEELGQTIKKYQLTDKQRAEIQRMNVQLEIARQKLQYLKDRAILKIMPYWVTFVKSISRVSEGLVKTVKWLTTTKLGIVALAGTITTVLIPAIRALYLAISSHPIVAAITLALGALYLFIDDLVVFLRGGKSGIGVILYFFDELKNKIQSIQTPPILRDLIYLIKHSDGLLKVLQYLNSYGLLKNTLQNTIDKEKEDPNSLQPVTRAVKGGKKVIDYFNLGYLLNNDDNSDSSAQQRTLETNILNNFIKGVKKLNHTFGLDAHTLHRAMITPMKDVNYFNDNDNRTAKTNHSTEVNMNNYFNTNQPVNDIARELRYINAQFA